MDLANRFGEKGDKEAARKLVTSNLRLVMKIALNFQLFLNMGLYRAFDRQDSGLGWGTCYIPEESKAVYWSKIPHPRTRGGHDSHSGNIL